MRSIILLAVSIASIILFTGCATKTSTLVPIQVTVKKSEEIRTLSCEQITASLSVLEKRAKQIAMIQDEKAKSDTKLLSWGWILYGVPYLFLDGDGPEKIEFQTILGEKAAMEEVFIQKNCSLSGTDLKLHNSSGY